MNLYNTVHKGLWWGKRMPPEDMYGEDLPEGISNTLYAHWWRLNPDYVNTNLRVN